MSDPYAERRAAYEEARTKRQRWAERIDPAAWKKYWQRATELRGDGKRKPRS